MASRWMNQMRARERQYKRKLANSATTEVERRFYRPKILINKQTGQIVKVESMDDHIRRMQQEAAQEQVKPREPPRLVARIQQIPSILELPINHDERLIIRNKLIRDDKNRILLRPGTTIHDLETAILRYRRLVRIPEMQREHKESESIQKIKEEAVKTAKARRAVRASKRRSEVRLIIPTTTEKEEE